jgi:hypothetical protein
MGIKELIMNRIKESAEDPDAEVQFDPMEVSIPTL